MTKSPIAASLNSDDRLCQRDERTVGFPDSLIQKDPVAFGSRPLSGFDQQDMRLLRVVLHF